MNTYHRKMFSMRRYGLILLLMGFVGQALALDEVETVTAPVAESLVSPRATMATFIHSMNDILRGDKRKISDAVATLDLQDVNPLIRNERGETLAWLLLDVMDKTRKIDLANIPDSSDGDSWVFHQYLRGSIQISRQDNGQWLFDRSTMTSLSDIVDEMAKFKTQLSDNRTQSYLPWHLRFRQDLPASMKYRSFLLENWQWLGLLLIIAVGLLVDKLVSLLLRASVRSWKSKSNHQFFTDISDNLLRPLGLMAMAILWWIGLSALDLREDALVILLVAVKFLASISAVWSAFRLVDLASARLLHLARVSDNKLDDVLAPLVPKVLKIFVTVIGIVFIADNLNIDVTSLVAGLGLGGLAFALAAKDLVQNIFGSLTVLLDRTFTVGDWIKVGDTEGTVEQIGFRSTRLRTFYNSLLTVPNSKFITSNVDNMGQRTYRRLSTQFGVTYQTPPDTVEAFCEGIRELVRQHPYMRKDYYHVYLNNLGGSSLDIMIYVFWETPEWSTELRERHRFLLDCIRLAERLGVEFAYPTQTLHMVQEQGEARPPETSMERGRDVAREVVDASTGLGVKPDPVSF